METLKGWRQFCDLRRQGVTLCSEKTDTNLNRFSARFNAAKRFRSVVMDGYSERTTLGYSAGIRLLLCYTSAELLGQTISPRINDWQIHDPCLVPVLRVTCGNLHQDENVLTHKGLRTKLQQFVTGQDEDLRVVATALRVMIAHGHFTPHGTKAITKKGTEAINCLGDHLLGQAEQRFNDCLATQLEDREDSSK